MKTKTNKLKKLEEQLLIERLKGQELNDLIKITESNHEIDLFNFMKSLKKYDQIKENRLKKFIKKLVRKN
tara:strand:+ start:1847 stop:2056 length:210 start_codon:yes stop_codon:yes gene_type:complete